MNGDWCGRCKKCALRSEELGVDEAGRDASQEWGDPEDLVVVPDAGD